MKATQCPKCQSTDTCYIESPSSWHCKSCKNKWEKKYSDDTDSFDYDQGFNINEVYDQ